nr:FMN-binding protein [Anaerococcus hydrogenalis]MDK7695521.1 FMN-binding protein [Anaerococcus hydrogenalis]MDK7697249.1 FMN-binding protein [Anaerococcus hydrogenalis]MDK7708548.1 FMN-binding protein [Anaerococcus hydrogenalis]
MKNTFLKKALTLFIVSLASVVMIKSSIFAFEKNQRLSAIKEKNILHSKVRISKDLKDGQYEASSEGYGGLLTVRISIENGKLTDIKIISHNETEEYFKKALAVIDEILRKGSVNVDSVSGATISSNAIKDAVAKALQKAGSKEKIKVKTKKKDRKKVEGLKDGEYLGSANGYGGILTVKVTIKNGKISAIDVISQNETPQYFRRAYAVINQILSTGSVNVDSISGATVSSNALKMAVADAIQKAGSKQQAKVQAVNNSSNANNRRGNLAGSVTIGNEDLKDGVYTGSGQGYNGPINVRVTISNGLIKNIEILSYSDDNPYFNRARSVLSRILGKPGKSVDTVSGATYSSRGIIDAVNNAIAKAGSKNQKVKQTKPSPSKNKKSNKNQKTGKSIGIGSNNKNLKDGIYEGISEGFNGPIKVRVTISKGSITNVEILSHQEDDTYFARAQSIITKILGKPGKSVDTVSGATYSSRGIIDAVNDAVSKAGGETIPSIPDKKPEEKPNVKPDENPGKKPEDKPGKKPEENIDDALKKYYNNQPLKDGEYTGWGIGYINTKKTKTYIRVENGEISEIKVGLNSEYGDDMGPFRKKAEKILSFLKGKEARLNIAKMGLYREYFETIRNSKNPKEKVADLFGKEYLNHLKGFRGDNSESDLTLLSRTVKSYMSNRYGSKDLFDSISGATVSASGISAATREAAEKSSNDYKTNTNVKEISIISPKNKNIEVNKGEGVDFSELKVKITKKDGSSKELGWKDFQANGISIKDSDGKTIENGNDLKKYGDTRIIKAKVVHEKSLSYDEFRILVGNYSKDYIIGLEYSADGKKWYKIDKVDMDYADSRNIASHQTIDAPKSFEFEKVKIRLVSKKGNRYEYVTDKLPVNRQVQYKLLEGDNPNLPKIIYAKFELSGKESDKHLVEEKENGQKEKEKPQRKEEIEVDQKVIDTSLMESNGQKWIEGQPIRPATVTSLDPEAKIVGEIEGLPKGLTFDGKTITGTIDPIDKGWPEDGSGFKTIKLKFKAEKGDKLLVRTIEYWLYRDKDRDGISDDDDIDQGEKFTPLRANSQAIIVNGKAPSLEDYKAKFSNIPKDGSVEVSFKKEPDYSKVSERPQRVYLQFKAKNAKEVGEAYVMVVVKKAAETEKPQRKEEIEVDQKVIDTSLMESNGQQWIEGQTIRPATVTSLDPEAKIVGEIEGLPKGLTFDGKTITGTIDPIDKGWPEDGSGFKTIKLKFKAEKGDKLLVRKITYWLYRDKDRDGLADGDEKDLGEKFTPQRANSQAIIVDGKAPSLEDYKAKFSNIPKDGSVEVSFKKQPDYEKVSERPQRVYLQFKAKNTKEVGEAYVMVVVKKAAKNEKPQTKEEIEVDQKVIDTSLMESNGQKWVEGQSIRPATVTSLLDGANILPEIEGLPKGLKFDGKTITGTPERSDEGWPADGSGFKTIKLKFKAEKGDKILVRTVEYWLYRDKDRDGISDDEDIDQGEKFTPISSNRQPIIVEGKAPSLEDYKAKFSNIPKDGSVEVSFKKEPDYSKVSDRPQRVYLQFKSKYSKEVGEAYVMVIVKKAVKKENKEVRSLNQKTKKKKEEIKENSIKKTKEKNSNSQPVDNKKDTKENESNDKSNNKELEESEKESNLGNTQNPENSHLPPLEIKKESPVMEDENDSDKKVQ